MRLKASGPNILMAKIPPAIQLKNADKKEYMRFENNGSVYLKGRKINVDKEIAQAFTYCVIEMSGLTPHQLIKEIIKKHGK